MRFNNFFYISMVLLTTLAFTTAGVPIHPNTDTRFHFAFDHVAVILDSATVKAMRESPLLKSQFANSGYQKSQVESGIWSGFYLYGALTYLEFTDHISMPVMEIKTGDGMIAFNAEKVGSVDWIIARMSERYPESNPIHNLRYMKIGNDRIPFSHTAMFKYDSGHEGFGAWVMEYHQEFRNRITGGRAKIGDISRFKAGPAVRHHPEKYFKDVVSVTVAVSEIRRDNLVKLLTELGYKIESRENMTVCTGTENVVELIPKINQKYTITRIEVSLTRPKVGEKVYRFGSDVTLTFDDKLEATWEFLGTRD